MSVPESSQAQFGHAGYLLIKVTTVYAPTSVDFALAVADSAFLPTRAGAMLTLSMFGTEHVDADSTRSVTLRAFH